MNLTNRSRGRRSPGNTLSRAFIPVIALFLLVPGPARADDPAVSVQSREGCGVQGVFLAPVPSAIAWQVLTDYDGISRFVHSMQSSRLERGPEGQKRVRQDAVAKAFLVRRHMRLLLEIQEVRGKRIGFRDVLGKDFRSYTGEWRLSAVSGETKVEYEVMAEPRAAVARALCRGMLRNTAQQLLEEVRAEMMRRAAVASDR